MIQELLYTSHEGRGLRQGGGGGFCTVLSTEGMASNLAAALEKLSGYKHPFDIHDPRSVQNPINYRHAIIRIGGINYHVLSRIADLRGEHTGRSNKLAHHVVLTTSDLVVGGPTVLLKHPEFCRTTWDGKVQLVSQQHAASLPTNDLSPKVCRYWHQIVGDAGWAGYVAEQLLKTPNPAVSVIFPLGTDTLSLTDEVFSLIPSDKRWSFTFSTYYAVAPPITSCHLRFVLDETTDAEQLRRDYRQVVVDLSNISQKLPQTALVTAARLGTAPKNENANDKLATQVTKPSVASDRKSSSTINEQPLPASVQPVSSDSGEYELLPPIVATKATPTRARPYSTAGPYVQHQATLQKRRTRKWIVAICVALAAACLLVCAATVLVLGGKYLLARTSATKPNQEAESPTKPPAKESTNESTDPNQNKSKPVIVDPKPDQPTLQVQTTSKASNGGTSDPVSGKAGPSQAQTVKQTSGAELQSPPVGPSASTDPGPPLPPKVLIPPQVLPLPQFSVTSPPDRDLLKAVQLKLPPQRGDLVGIELIGIGWLAEQWKTLDNSNEIVQKADAAPGILRVVRKSKSTLIEPEVLCQWKLNDDVLEFTWSAKSISQVETNRKKAGLLNGLRWCIVKISTTSGPQYVRLSNPDGDSVQFTLFPYSEKPPLVSSALPRTIKTKLQSPEGIQIDPSAFHKFGGSTRDILLHKDTFGGELKSAIAFVNDDSFQWYLNVKSTLAFVHEGHGPLSGELESQSKVQLARQNISETVNAFTTEMESIRRQIGELEKPRPNANAQERKQDADKATKLKYQVETMGKKKLQLEQLLTYLGSFEQRNWTFVIRQEYEDGDQFLIVPILGKEGSVDGQSIPPERFQ